MFYISTRDSNKKKYKYTETLLEWLAPDWGLFIPYEYPQISKKELESLKNSPYTDIAFSIKQKFVWWDIPDDILKNLVKNAYRKDKFPDSINWNITPVRKIDENLYIQNLSLWPTAAFKDMAMQFLWQEMNYELTKKWEKLTILWATSWDTWSAAEAAMKGLDSIKLFMLSPEIGMSSFQKAQMWSLSWWNIINISIKWRFDDCQDMVKDLKNSKEFSKLWAVNSINWWRISSQVAYYFSGYLQVVDKIGEEVDFCIPSGNFGNVLSWYIAKKMWLPIRKLIIATNENNVLDRLFKTWVYSLSPASITSSPSMDISKASNYERLVFELLDKNADKLSDYMNTFSEKGTVNLSDYWISVENLKTMWFLSGSSSHFDRLNTIKWVYEKSKTYIDPHTADGIKVARDLRDENIKTICMETALAVKFEDTIKEAIWHIPERETRFKNLENLNMSDSFYLQSVDREELKEFIKNN